MPLKKERRKWRKLQLFNFWFCFVGWTIKRGKMGQNEFKKHQNIFFCREKYFSAKKLKFLIEKKNIEKNMKKTTLFFSIVYYFCSFCLGKKKQPNFYFKSFSKGTNDYIMAKKASWYVPRLLGECISVTESLWRLNESESEEGEKWKEKAAEAGHTSNGKRKKGCRGHALYKNRSRNF